jgi:hypothetical protein
MLADVVDLEGKGDLATLGARIRLVEQHLLTQAEPPSDAVPAADIHVGAHGMAGTGSTGHEDRTSGLGTVLHRLVPDPVRRLTVRFDLLHYV